MAPTPSPVGSQNSTTKPFCPTNLGTPSRSTACGHGCVYQCSTLTCVLSYTASSWQVACDQRTGTAATPAASLPLTATGNPSEFTLNGDKFSLVYRKSSLCRSGSGAVSTVAPLSPTAWNSTWINWGTQAPRAAPSASSTWARLVVATTVANTDSDWKASLSLVLDLAKGELKETETWLSTSGSANKLFVFVTADVCATFRKLQSLSTNAAQRLLLGGTDIVERNDKFQFRADDEEASTDSPAPMQTLDLAVLVAVPATLLGLMK